MSNLRSLLGQKGLYYSEKCFRDNLRIIDERKKQIPVSDYDKIKEQDLSHYQIGTTNNTATLKCSDVSFSFCNGEYFSVVHDLIQRSMKGAFKVTIIDTKNNREVSISDKIINNIQYKLKIDGKFPFKNMKGVLSKHKMNYFSTVKDAKCEISFSLPNCLINPDEVTIYDENKQKIDDPNRKLISIPNFEYEIFYSIDENSIYTKALSDVNLTRMTRNCYGDLNPITNYLAKKGLFYSKRCLKNKLYLTVSGNEVKDYEFNSYKNVKRSQIEIKNGLNIVTLDYNEMKFILCNDEKITAAIGLIEKTFKVSNLDVSIYDSYNKKLPTTLLLNEIPKYKVEVNYTFRFKMLNTNDYNIQKMDYLSTVNDAKLRLLMIHFVGDLEKIIIYDDDKTEIESPNQKLINIPNYQRKIYFEIDTSRGAQLLNGNQKYKGLFNPKRDENKCSSSLAKEYPKLSVPSFTLTSKDDTTPNPKPAQKIQSINDEKPNKKDPEPETEEPVPESIKPSKKRVIIKGPTVVAIKTSPVQKIPINKKSSSNDEAESGTSNKNNERKPESEDELTINFVFNKDLEKNYYPFKRKLNTKITIKQIREMIIEKYKIEDRIKISYKYKNSFCEIDDSLSIDEIRDEMIEKGNNGKSQNFLYIDIKKQVRKSKPDPIIRNGQKAAKNSSSSDDDSVKKLKKSTVARKPSHDSIDEKPSLKHQTKTLAILASYSSSEDEKPPKKQTRNAKDSISEVDQLKKENDELRSQIEDYQLLFSFFNKSSNDENLFIDQSEEERYHKVISKIGEGSTSITYKVIDTRNESFICKKVLKDNDNIFKNGKNMMKEFEILHNLNHPCICHAYRINTSEIVKDANIETKEGMPEKTTVSLFLEFLDHKLSDLLKNSINNTLKVRIVVEVAHAMNFLHKKGMIHRDLKIDNIMLNSVYEAKVVDFGLARIHELFDSKYSLLNESMSKGIGTLDFMSPEMLNQNDYDYKTDVYSFGIVLYFIFIGNLPKQSMKDKTNGKLINFPSSSSSISNFCIDLIKRCLSFDPSKRPSFEDILNDIRKNKYLLASYIDQSVIYIRDHELELFNKYKK